MPDPNADMIAAAYGTQLALASQGNGNHPCLGSFRLFKGHGLSRAGKRPHHNSDFEPGTGSQLPIPVVVLACLSRCTPASRGEARECASLARCSETPNAFRIRCRNVVNLRNVDRIRRVRARHWLGTAHRGMRRYHAKRAAQSR
jgi:hypothetical protein